MTATDSAIAGWANTDEGLYPVGGPGTVAIAPNSASYEAYDNTEPDDSLLLSLSTGAAAVQVHAAVEEQGAAGTECTVNGTHIYVGSRFVF